MKQDVTISAAQAEIIAKIQARVLQTQNEYSVAVSVALAGQMTVPPETQILAVEGQTVTIAMPE